MVNASIEKFESRLIEALENGEWAGAERAADRLKSLLLDSVVQDDPEAVTRITSILAEGGERVELRHRLRLKDGPEGTAWKLRGDSGTGILAMRLRPLLPAAADDAHGNLDEAIVKLLREANSPMNNKQIALRMGRDEPSISRRLKRLAAQGRIRQFKQGAKLFNAPAEPNSRPQIELMRRSREIVETPYPREKAAHRVMNRGPSDFIVAGARRPVKSEPNGDDGALVATLKAATPAAVAFRDIVVRDSFHDQRVSYAVNA